MIKASHLTKYYGQVAAIQDVSFEVAQGEIIGFLGPNGAGKSTTMRILTGFSPPSEGTAEIAGFDIAKQPIEVKRRVGYLPENVPLYTEMVVSRFLRYVAEVKGIDRDKRAAEVGRAMERCGLESMANRLIGHLSKGYRQRVGLAQALVGDPPVLILDEPTVGLDPRQIVDIRQMIKDLAQDHTVLLSTHILPEVAMICQRVLIIHQGRLVAQDSMANLTGTDARLEIAVAGDGNIREILASVPGVKEVTQTGPAKFSLRAAHIDSTTAAVTQRLVEAGVKIHRVEPRARTLEDVFIEAISGELEAEPAA